jgi:hypothetical protein
MSDINEAEPDDEEKGEALIKSIARTSERTGRRGVQLKEKEMPKLAVIMGLLNQAQMIVEVDPSRSRRLLSQARRMLNRN